ncbi:hypothetical protein ACP4OV_030403 [Aristida adscensionis]
MFSYLLPNYLLLVFVQTLLSCNTVAAGNVSTIMAFGDSIIDTGNNNYIATIGKGNFPPYGRDYDGGIPTGRFSNGRLIIDFISEAFGFCRRLCRTTWAVETPLTSSQLVQALLREALDWMI